MTDYRPRSVFPSHPVGGDMNRHVMVNPFKPIHGGGVSSPSNVPGKEVSHHPDRNQLHLFEPGRIQHWDGKGGTVNSFNYNLVGYNPPISPGEVDAIANHFDALYCAVTHNEAARLFTIQGESFIRFESISGGHRIWATAPIIDHSTDFNIDGLEVWGP